MKLFKTILFALISTFLFGQTPTKILDTEKIQQITLSKKGKIRLSFGYNWSYYTKSNIHFKGPDHEFTLYKVVANDRPTPFSWNRYFNLFEFSIPQTNYSIGYFLNDHYEIGLKIDHMKYVVQRGQQTKITGSIENSSTDYDGSYNYEDFIIKPDFLEFEHTDGLNYFSLEIQRHDDILAWFKKYPSKFALHLLNAVAVGPLLPRTDSQLFGQPESDKYHLAGFGCSLKTGLSFTFFSHFFIQGELKGGYINLCDVLTTPSPNDKAKHDFFFFQPNFQFGGHFRLGKKASQQSKN